MSRPDSLARIPGAIGAGCVLLSAFLLLPRFVSGKPAGPHLRICLVDVSASAVRPRPDWLPWVRAEVRREARLARDAGEDLAVISFADGVAVTFPPGAPVEFLDRLDGGASPPFDPRSGAGEDGATRLARALESAGELLLARAGGELVLLGDGSYTDDGPGAGSPEALLARLGIPLRSLPPPPPALGDLALLELSLPRRLEDGAPLVALARFSWRPGKGASTASLAVEIDHPAQARAFNLSLDLPPYEERFELPIDCGTAGFGRTEVRLACRLAPGPDALSGNDRAEAATVASGERVIGVVAPRERLAPASSWLAPGGRSALAGLQFAFLEPAELPLALAELDALVVHDLALHELSAPLLVSFVEHGGGLLVLAGWRFLRGWIPGEPGGALHAILPLVPAALERGPRDVVLLVDGSGSMSGEPFETVRAAALDLVDAALPDDRVSLRFFTGRLEREHLLKPRDPAAGPGADAGRAAARALLALRVPEGTTHLFASLEEFAGEIGGRETLALLLTDGRERDPWPDPAAEGARLLARLDGVRARLVVIAVGDADLELLGHLTEGDQAVLRGENLEDLRAIFRRELRGAQLAEGERLPVRASAMEPDSLAASVLEPAGDPELPPLRRYVRDELRPGAESLWESEDGEPLLGLQRVGLGRTAVFASLPDPEWAPEWSGRSGLGEPREFDGLLRWLARGPGRREETPLARVEDDTLVVEGLARDAPPRLSGTLVDRAGEPVLSRLELLPGAELGRDPWTMREARLPGGRPDDLVLVAPELGEALAVVDGLPDELAHRERRVRLAEAADGGAAGARAPGGERARPHPLGPWTLGAGLAALFLAGLVACREGRDGRPGGQGAGANVR